MSGFLMCAPCRAEYEGPSDRRFHAQPNACPDCGPRLALLDGDGRGTASGDEALRGAARAIRAGEVVAVKGLGGFHLVADAACGAALRHLREGKPRREKPFAMMVRDVAQAESLCLLPDGARGLLSSPEAPILLLPRRPGAPVAEEVAPGNPNLGIMLPPAPLHHLLLRELGFPVVATSGNLSDEPICIDEGEAVARLGGIAHRFLVHDRPIRRHMDDSIAWFLCGGPRLLRRARGYAPLPVRVRANLPPILAVGAHVKNTIALGLGGNVFVSQHIGDLESPQALAAFERVIDDFLALYDARPVAIAHDLHPDYLSTQWAREAAADRLAGAALVPVQHHHAHLASVLAENGAGGTALGVCWDGTGYGADGTIWGGEFLRGSARGFTRLAHLRPFRLPGGDAAIREPRRTALALLWEIEGEAALGRAGLPPLRSLGPGRARLLGDMIARGVRSPVTTSAGRLFDGVAALLGLRQETSFEGQAAMDLEFAADPAVTDAYPLLLDVGGSGGAPLVLDWGPLVAEVVEDAAAGVAVGTIAARFLNALVGGIVAVAGEAGEERVALTGGCFLNRWLSERCVRSLEAGGFLPLLHREVPPGDGGISLGQVAVASARLAER